MCGLSGLLYCLIAIAAAIASSASSMSIFYVMMIQLAQGAYHVNLQHICLCSLPECNRTDQDSAHVLLKTPLHFWQGQDIHQGKPDPVNGSGSGAVPSSPPAKPGPAPDMDRAGPSMALPESDAECAALPAVQSYPTPGDIVAYKLLEIGASWAPEVETSTSHLLHSECLPGFTETSCSCLPKTDMRLRG